MSATTESGSSHPPDAWAAYSPVLRAKIRDYRNRCGDYPNVLYIGYTEYDALRMSMGPAMMYATRIGHFGYNGLAVVNVGLHSYLEVGYAA